MADDKAVMFSIGFLEQWVAQAGELANAINTDAALLHLKIVEDAFTEYRRNIGAFRKIVAKVKELVDAASAI